MQRTLDRRVGQLEKTGCELVQQAPDFFCSDVEDARMVRLPLAMQLHMLQGLFQCPGDIRQGLEADRGGTTPQRVRQGHGGIRNRMVQFQLPLAQLRQQAARPFVGLVEVDVVERDADAQVSDHLDLLVKGLRRQRWRFLGRIHRLHASNEGRRQLGRRGLRIGCRPEVQIKFLRDIEPGIRLRRKGRRRSLLGVGIDGLLHLRRCDRLAKIEIFNVQTGRLDGCRQPALHTLHAFGIKRLRGLEIRPYALVLCWRGRKRLGGIVIRTRRLGCSHRRLEHQRGFEFRHGRGHSLQRAGQVLWRLHHRQRGCFLGHRRAGSQQGDALVVQPQTIRGLAKGLCGPGRRGQCGDVLHPAAELAHGFVAQTHQILAGRLLFCQPGIGQLLHRPCRLAELVEPHHSGTALERMEGPAQAGLLSQVRRSRNQRLHRLHAVVHHLARFLQENFAHLRLVCVHRLRHRNSSQHRCNRLWRRHRDGRRRRCGRRGNFSRRDRGLRHGSGGSLARRGFFAGSLVAAHDGLELACFVVVHKQLFGQCPLVTQHVDQETHRAKAVAQLLEYGGAHIHLVHQEFFDAVAHAQRRHRSLVQTQHGKHSPHLRQLAGHLVQRDRVLRIAEKLVQRFFNLTQRSSQFVHHAAHGLAVADPAVQLLHPPFKRFRLCAAYHVVQAVRQPGAALGHPGFRRIEIVVRRLQVQDGGGNFHRHRRRRRLSNAHRGFDGTRQCACQVNALRMQPDHGFSHGGELFRRSLEPVGVPTRQCGPGFGCRGDAFACLDQERRIETAELRRCIVERPGTGQPVRLPHRCQDRRVRWRCGHSLGTIKQKILRQSVDHARLAAGQGRVLGNDARGGALHKHIVGTQAAPQRLEERRADAPEHARFHLAGVCGQTQADAGHGTRRLRVAGTDHLEHRLVDTGTHRRIVGQWRRRHRQRHVNPTPHDRPQIGRMDTVASHQFEHVAVLREQCHRRGGLAFEHSFQIFRQREAGTLYLVRGILTAQLRALHEFLRQGFHAAQYLGRSTQAHHFQRSHGLVQLLARYAQLARIELRQVRTPRQLGVAHEPPQRLGCAIQRFPKFVQHPGQRAQVTGRQFTFTGCC